MDLATVISVVFPLMTLITGGACILLFSITTTLRASNGDLRDRVGDLESQLKDERTENGNLRIEIDAWRQTVTGEVQLNAILTLLEAHDKLTVVEHARLEKSLDTIVSAMEQVRHILSQLEN